MIDPANRQTRGERLAAVLRELQRRFGPWIVYRLKDARPRAAPAGTIPSGALSLDQALGNGYPRGRIVEITGPSGSGKSLLAFHLLANAQRQGGFGVYVDADHHANYEQMARCGVNLADLFLVVPESAPEALEVAALLVESHGLDALVTGPLAELIGNRAEVARAAAARLARLNAVLDESPTSVLFLDTADPNRPRPLLASFQRALRHFASVRLQVTPLVPLRHSSGDLLGGRVRVTTIKNKLAPPQRQTILELRRDRGIHPEADLLDLGMARGVVVETAAGLCLDTHFLGRGRARALSALESDAELARLLQAKLCQGENRGVS